MTAGQAYAWIKSVYQNLNSRIGHKSSLPLFPPAPPCFFFYEKKGQKEPPDISYPSSRNSKPSITDIPGGGRIFQHGLSSIWVRRRMLCRTSQQHWHIPRQTGTLSRFFCRRRLFSFFLFHHNTTITTDITPNRATTTYRIRRLLLLPLLLFNNNSSSNQSRRSRLSRPE